MSISRRKLIKLSAAGATALAVGGRVALAARGPVDEIGDGALEYFKAQGFGEIPPQDLITGEDFNGGLRYDDTRPESESGSWVSIQPAARTDDIGERQRPGVLAGFNIIGLSQPDPDDGTILPAVLRFLLDERGLDPAKMLFVSTDEFRPHIARTEGIGVDRFLERPMEVARAMGDGSGYFAPAGHPYGPAIPSVGLYYPVPGAAPGGDPVYPPPDYIELAEVGIAPDASGNALAGIGLERLAMAEDAEVPDFDGSRLNLLRLIEDEAERTGKPLPEGYRMFASL